MRLEASVKSPIITDKWGYCTRQESDGLQGLIVQDKDPQVVKTRMLDIMQSIVDSHILNEQDRFVDNHFPTPPNLTELINDSEPGSEPLDEKEESKNKDKWLRARDFTSKTPVVFDNGAQPHDIVQGKFLFTLYIYIYIY